MEIYNIIVILKMITIILLLYIMKYIDIFFFIIYSFNNILLIKNNVQE